LLNPVTSSSIKSLGATRSFKAWGWNVWLNMPISSDLANRRALIFLGEVKGLVPTQKWKRINYAESWTTGDTYNLAIGQGFILVTPLQLLNATAAVANGGTLYRPQIVYQVTDADGRVIRPFAPEVIRQVPVSHENLAVVREGMRMAVEWGTAQRAKLAGIEVAGKTGSAEYPGPPIDDEGHLPTHAWFTAFAPVDEPKIALVVFVAGGGEGSKIAVPIAAEILRYYFGLPKPQPAPPPPSGPAE
jgi:penicillin-binding protein 2